MRVLYVNQWSGLGGAEISLLRLFANLPRGQVQAVLACPPGDLAQRAQRLGVQVVPIQIPPVRSCRPLRAIDVQSLQQAIASCDLVHAYSVRAGWYAGRLCRQLCVPMVWSIHDVFPFAWQQMWLQVVAQRYAQAVVVYSQVLARQFGTRLQHRVHLVPHGVEVEVFAPLGAAQREQVRRRYDTPAHAPVVLHVGRVMPFKGQHLFLQMARRLLSRYPAERAPVFWLAGDESVAAPRYARRVRALAEGLTAHVRWLGFQDEIAPIIASAEVLVHCSTRPEPFGLVVIEAMACGTAVVSANRGAPVEILEDGRTGLLTPPQDVRALANAVDYLLTHEQERQAIVSRARRVACERYTLQQHVQQLVDLYRRLL
ncbi:MAG: glycosyltransferase family 4 protein [Armatimonadota bacterium]|nr:glycosyltransferase family 4 protein [Armatimonadota bacterium]